MTVRDAIITDFVVTLVGVNQDTFEWTRLVLLSVNKSPVVHNFLVKAFDLAESKRPLLIEMKEGAA